MVSFQISLVTIHLLLFYCFITGLHGLIGNGPPYSFCVNTTNYAAGSSFQYHLDNLLLSLSSNASVSKFYNISAGNGPDAVYGLYLCLDYVTDEDCHECITIASQDIRKLCPSTKEAVVWEEVCQLRYSDQRFFSQLDVTGNLGLNNVMNFSEPERDGLVVTGTLRNLTRKAAFDQSANRYATDGESLQGTDTIYALVQCTKDLSANDCNTCLETAITNISICCSFSIGARLLSSSCYLRYELYAFYEGAISHPRKSILRKTWLIITLPTVSALALLSVCMYYLAMKCGTQRVGPNNSHFQFSTFWGRDDRNAPESAYMDLASIYAATDFFSDSNFLGQGGFGPVYKGVLKDGKEVAVKRLSSCSEQGSEEFTNEVLLIMKLQHKNLVRLLGFCADGEEKLLVYEYLPNSSLDVILFDRGRCAQLNWSTRLKIINGIARGILYLHEDSRLRIIHRDLKAGNVLLDNDMNPKISDFGMARIFAGSEGEANTARIVGTYGYMAPEYAMEGLYSIKSDVFSFGVLLLEIITGRRNAGFHLSKRAPSLLSYAWNLRNEGRQLELVDPLLIDSFCADEFLRYIHIGLLCVQEDAYGRPTMSSVVLMLQSETVTLCQPERPAFSVGRFTEHHESDANDFSVNGLTISTIVPR